MHRCTHVCSNGYQQIGLNLEDCWIKGQVSEEMNDWKELHKDGSVHKGKAQPVSGSVTGL